MQLRSVKTPALKAEEVWPDAIAKLGEERGDSHELLLVKCQHCGLPASARGEKLLRFLAQSSW